MLHYRVSQKGKREREKGPKKIFEELTADNFPNLAKETVTRVQIAEYHTKLTHRGIHHGTL